LETERTYLRAVDHGRLVGPVVLAIAQLEGPRRRGDRVDVAGVADAGFDDQDLDVGVLGETAGDDAASGATWGSPS
jgi:hypothetical protein